jgi:hypothetical protein
MPPAFAVRAGTNATMLPQHFMHQQDYPIIRDARGEHTPEAARSQTLFF